jgi:hypothetical protein
VDGCHCIWLGQVSSAANLSFAQPSKNYRSDDQNARKAANHAADDWRGQGLHHFRSGAVAPQNRQLVTIVATVITIGRSRNRAPSFTARIKSTRELFFPSSARFLATASCKIDHHHDSSLNRRSEQREITNPNSDSKS